VLSHYTRARVCTYSCASRYELNADSPSSFGRSDGRASSHLECRIRLGRSAGAAKRHGVVVQEYLDLFVRAAGSASSFPPDVSLNARRRRECFCRNFRSTVSEVAPVLFTPIDPPLRFTALCVPAWKLLGSIGIAFIAALDAATEDDAGTIRKDGGDVYCCPPRCLSLYASLFVAAVLVAGETPRGTIPGEKREASAHKFADERRPRLLIYIIRFQVAALCSLAPGFLCQRGLPPNGARAALCGLYLNNATFEQSCARSIRRKRRTKGNKSDPRPGCRRDAFLFI